METYLWRQPSIVIQAGLGEKEKGPGRGWWGPPKGTHGKGGEGEDDVTRARFSEESILNGARLERTIPRISSEEDESFLGSQIEDVTEQMRDIYGDYDEDTFERLGYDYVSGAITDWNIESDRGGALFLQVGASQELGIPLADHIRRNVEKVGGNPFAEFPEEKRLANVLYSTTQSYLEGRGFSPTDKVVLYRGSGRSIVGSDVRSNTLESWTTSRQAAEFYVKRKGGGVVLATEIPIKSIFALPQTGLGIASVQEVVILGSLPHPVVKVGTQ